MELLQSALDLLTTFWSAVLVPFMLWVVRVERRLVKIESDTETNKDYIKETREDVKEVKQDIKTLLRGLHDGSTKE